MCALPILVVEKERLCAALAFVVARARAYGVHIAPVPFGLGVNGRVSVDLACRGLETFSAEPLREPQHVYRPRDVEFSRLDRTCVVLGKGWSVRVDIGGRRKVKNKK